MQTPGRHVWLSSQKALRSSLWSGTAIIHSKLVVEAQSQQRVAR